jgi:SAM-dependent methyltransferase
MDATAPHGTPTRGVSANPRRDTTRSGSSASPLHSVNRSDDDRSAGGRGAEGRGADGAAEFRRRVDALLGPDTRVLDLRAGRGVAREDDVRRHGASVVRIDVDPTRRRRSAGAARVVAPGAPLPLDDASIDVVVADRAFEHVDDPAWVGRELGRVLRPDGWICARTPSRWGSLAVLDRIRRGGSPYRLNTRAALARYFPPEQYLHAVTAATAGNAGTTGTVAPTPPRTRPVLLVFLRRYDAPGPARQPRTAGVTVEEIS